LSHALFITTKARGDLAAIAEALVDWTGDADTGEAFTLRIVAKCERLAALGGQLGQSREDLGVNLRSSPLGHYLIIFRYGADELAVVAVVDGRRDLSTLVFLDDAFRD